MIIGVQDVYYNVKDMQRAVEFYAKVLGMQVEFADDYWSSLRIGGTKIGLHWSGGESVPPLPHDEHGAHAGATLTLKSDNIEEDKKRLVDSGVEILGASDDDWGKLVVFYDPDKNILKLMEPNPNY